MQGNTYSWIKDQDINNPVATTATYEIDNFSVADAGSYFVRIVNSLLPNLELDRLPYELGINLKPTGLSLDNNLIKEREVPGTKIGTFTTEDPNQNATQLGEFVYTLDDESNIYFEIVGDELRSRIVFDSYRTAFL